MSKIKVITAIPLDKKEENKFLENLANKFGGDNQIQFEVDSNLISGFKIIIDSKMIDLSAQKKLENLRELLKENL